VDVLTPKSRELLGLFLLALAVRNQRHFGRPGLPHSQFLQCLYAGQSSSAQVGTYFLINVIIVPTYVLHRRKYLGRPGPVKREAETVLEAAKRWLGGVIDELVPLY